MKATTNTSGTVTLTIDGMTCGHCVEAVTKALSAVPGVKVRSVAVGSAVIEATDGWTTGNALAALEEAGYAAKRMGESANAGPLIKADGGCCRGGAKALGANGATNSGCCCG